jgi:hypothetical protein
LFDWNRSYNPKLERIFKVRREVDVYKEALTFNDTTKSVVYSGEWNDALDNLNCKMDGCGIREIEYTTNGTEYYFGSF